MSIRRRRTAGAVTFTVRGPRRRRHRDFQAAQHADDTWWASWYPIDGHLKNGAKLSTASGYAATFVTFNVDGDPRKARGYAKNVAGVEIDRYEVIRK